MTRIIKYKNYQFNRSLSIKKTLKSDTILSKQVTHVFRKSPSITYSSRFRQLPWQGVGPPKQSDQSQLGMTFY
jgi:hypothetical protein